MKSKNLTVVASSENYLPSLNALFNSIDYWKIDTDVVLLSYKLPENYLKRIKDVFDFNIKIIQAPEGEQTKVTAIERFRVACEEGKNYEAILLLDADMFFMSNVDLYFQVASKGFIVCASNSMIISFNKGKDGYQDHYGVFLEEEKYPYPEIHTSVPIWLSPLDLDWFQALYDSRRTDSFDDFLLLNLLGIKMGKNKKMLTFPAYRCTNIHHTMLKPVIGIIRKGDLVLSGTEERMICAHGKLHDENYIKDLAMVMERFFKDEQLGERQRKQMLNSREVLLEEFMKYTYLKKLDLREFVHVEWLEKKLKEKNF